jgi:hypothetical protein
MTDEVIPCLGKRYSNRASPGARSGARAVHTCVERWAPNAGIVLPVPGGIELLVVGGEFNEGGETFAAQSCLQLPSATELRSRDDGPVL